MEDLFLKKRKRRTLDRILVTLQSLCKRLKGSSSLTAPKLNRRYLRLMYFYRPICTILL